jgi:biotin carboxylase
MTTKTKSKTVRVAIEKTKKKIVLFVGPAPTEFLAKWIKDVNPNYLIYNLDSKKQKEEKIKKSEEVFDKVVQCSFSKDDSIAKALEPFKNKIIAITSRSEAKMWYLRRTIPHLPYIKTPTESSLLWATDKIEMRKRLLSYDSTITPKFEIIKDAEGNTIERIEKKIGYPLMVKPSGLAQSMLVTNCYHREELDVALKVVFKQANIFHKLYKEFYKDDTPQVLVEELMEGEMYSVDGVVNSKGKCYIYPPVHIKTGKQIGFDDYFGYQQMTPTLLKENSLDNLEAVTRKSVHAIGLRSTHFHAEFIRSEDGWKIIEIAPRIGGFRHVLYKESFGIDCTANDIRIRMGLIPKMHKSKKGYTAALKIFAKKEGKIKSIKGLKKIKENKSILSIKQNKSIGKRCKFAKNGGNSIFNIILHNKNRSELLADIRRVEQDLKIIVA